MAKNRKTTRPVGRPPVKQKQITEEIREQILSGTVPTAGRLPTREEFCQQYKASSDTVQQALSQLMADGFVVSRGKLGTFVSDNPPHLSRYAIVCSLRPEDSSFPRFWTAIESEAAQLRHDRELDLHLFSGVEVHSDNETYQQLLADIKFHRLAGIIFLHTPFEYANTPLLTEPGIARVAIMAPTRDYTGIQCVLTKQELFLERALDHLVARGRHRVAVLSQPFLPGGGTSSWLRELVIARQLHIEPYWIQFARTGEPMQVRQIIRLLMHENQSVLPDCLIIADDNLVEAASEGLVQAGVRVPEDLEIVAHCNYPLATSSVLPVKRLGFSADQLIRACVDSIDAQRRGGGIKPPIYIPAVFEDELAD